MTSDAARQLAYRLANKIGCDVEPERMEGYWNYWVHPSNLYEEREDPLEGDHCREDWQEVLDALHVYLIDLHLHCFGINEVDSESLRYKTLRPLLDDWVNRPQEETAKLVLADWLEDNNLSELSSLVRNCKLLHPRLHPALKRIKAAFANITFSGFDNGNNTINIPRPAFKKILLSGKVLCKCDYNYTDDYYQDNQDNFGKGIVQPETLLEYLDEKPNLLYLDIINNLIRFSPYRSLSYSIMPNP